MKEDGVTVARFDDIIFVTMQIMISSWFDVVNNLIQFDVEHRYITISNITVEHCKKTFYTSFAYISLQTYTIKLWEKVVQSPWLLVTFTYFMNK